MKTGNSLRGAGKTAVLSRLSPDHRNLRISGNTIVSNEAPSAGESEECFVAVAVITIDASILPLHGEWDTSGCCDTRVYRFGSLPWVGGLIRADQWTRCKQKEQVVGHFIACGVGQLITVGFQICEVVDDGIQQRVLVLR